MADRTDSHGRRLLRIGVATTQDDVHDPRSWSGTPHALFTALRRRGDVDAVPLGPLPTPWRGPEALRKLWYETRGHRYLWEREPRILRRYRRSLARRLDEERVDVVLSLGTIAAASLPLGVPLALYTDTTFHLNADYYPTMTGICRRSRRLGEAVDRFALNRAGLAVVSSDWAARDLVDHYGIPPERVRVVEMGAQHVCTWDRQELDRRVEARLDAPVELLWMGVEWERKGGDIAVAAAQELARRGLPVRLRIAGLEPPAPVRALPFVECLGFVDARTDGDRLADLLGSTYALLLPSRAENTSIVLADAASHGVPSLASDTGGMRTMVGDGANGLVLPYHAPPSAYADVVEQWWADPEGYRALARRSRLRFEEALNWDSTVDRLIEAMRGIAPVGTGTRPGVGSRR